MLTSKQSSQVPSEGEYKAATSILSATTMREACRHLLSCIGDVGSNSNNNNNNEAGSSSENNNKLDLVGIYKRVRDAADVVRRREAAVGKGGIGGGGGGGGGGQLEPPSPAVSRSQGKMASQHHQPQPRGRPLAPSGVLHGKHPLAVGKRKGSLGSRLGVSAAGRSLMTSAGASTGAGGSGGGPAQKRQRTGGVGGSGGGGGEGGDDAPPPSALSFLAALNKPGGAVGPPGAPPLHTSMAASAASSSSTSFPGARAGRSQPVPRSKPKKARPKEERASTTTPKGASAIKSERESTTSSAEKRKRKGRSGSSTVEDASANNNNSKVRSFEVGDDVLVIWNDGNRYAAIVKDVNAAEEINGCLLYDVEFDNGEIAENVKADDVVSPSDVEGEEDYEESD